MRGLGGPVSVLALAVGLWMVACQPEEPGTPELRSADGAQARGAQAAEEPRVEVITPEGAAPSPIFSRAIRAGGFIFLSGAIGTMPGTMELAQGGVEVEARQTMENIGTVLEAAGATFEDVVKCTVFLADIADYAAVNEVYRTYFPNRPPARSAVAGSGLALGARVEVECLALDPGV